ncbi:MAG TPA: endonuclease domain-containing protein [Chitinophagales bacterium]|nr:endonuclease domain-containing protein [Chitinophagales bacterium]
MKLQSIPKFISFSRELRKNQTPSEKLLWDKLRNRRLKGFKFLRQHPIIVSKGDGKTRFYIADFFCSEKKIVVEVDGGIHALQIEYDKERDVIMKDMGLVVLRFTNDEVTRNIYEVLGKIKEQLK